MPVTQSARDQYSRDREIYGPRETRTRCRLVQVFGLCYRVLACVARYRLGLCLEIL